MSIISNPVVEILLVIAAVHIILQIAGKVLFTSFGSRARRLYASSPWLPLRETAPSSDGEDIVFKTKDDQSLFGTWFTHSGESSRGVILYCHELNGNRLSAGCSIDRLSRAGFDVFTIDFRYHGQSRTNPGSRPTPWVSKSDIEDVKAAIDYIYTRDDFPKNRNIGLFGLSKGATIALATAANDSRVKAIVLDSPTPQGRLFTQNCWESLFKKRRYISTYFSFRYFRLFLKAALFALVCPFLAIHASWQRLILGFWCDCRFINTSAIARQIDLPVMVIHGTEDPFCQSEHIRAFCSRLPQKASLWLVPNTEHGVAAHTAAEEYDNRLIDFFAKNLLTE